MCEGSYNLIRTIHERMRSALIAMRAGGVPRDLAVAVVALSEGESGVQWKLTRPLPDDADCCGQIIGVESRVQSFTTRLYDDQEALNWLRDRGWLGWDPTTNTVAPAGGFGNPAQPQNAMLFFEYLAANRKYETMKVLSIGPTQRWIRWGETCGGPADVDEAWAFYSESDPARLLMNHLKYLIPARYVEGGCLPQDMALPDGGPSTSIPWLTRHAGNTHDASAIYYGGDPRFGSRRAYNQVWPEVNTLAGAVFA